MSNYSGDGVRNAMKRFYARQDVKDAAPKRKNEAPEKETEKAVTAWLRSQNIFHKIVESKAVLSSAYGGYRRGQADAGFPDIVGISNQGAFVAIELKALGRRANLSEEQRLFLTTIIERQGFACVTDSVSHLSLLFASWSVAPVESRQALLLADMPKKRAAKADDRPLFDDV